MTGQMKIAGLLIALALFGWSYNANSQIISTIAGNGTGAYSGDGGPAISAELYMPWGIAVDKNGNVYISDNANNAIRKINVSTGIISTIAGNGSSGFGGDGGPATSAELYWPSGVSLDDSGNVYISDWHNSRIRKVTTSTGNISTIAGNGTNGYAGDGGSAINAELYNPYGLSVDGFGNVYIADTYNSRIRKITVSTGIISTIAGNGAVGYAGDGGAATLAELDSPKGVYVDSIGNVYFADENNNAIREISVLTGKINTIAGTGIFGSSGDGGVATSAELANPTGVYLDRQGNIFIADWDNDVVREINAATGKIYTVAGQYNSYGFSGDGAAAASAQLRQPVSVCTDGSGNLYIVDSENNRIRKVSISGSGIVEFGTLKNEINIYPNPATLTMNITGVSGKVTLKIYDVLGDLVAQEEAESNILLNTSQLPQGVYTLVIENKESMAVRKIVIE
jgi:hypothetical protein